MFLKSKIQYENLINTKKKEKLINLSPRCCTIETTWQLSNKEDYHETEVNKNNEMEMMKKKKNTMNGKTVILMVRDNYAVGF